MRFPLLKKASPLIKLLFFPSFPSFLPSMIATIKAPKEALSLLKAKPRLPSMAEAATRKGLFRQSALIGGGASFSLFFPLEEAEREASRFNSLSSFSSHPGKLFAEASAFYRPSSLDQLPLGWERYESFLSFRKSLESWLFPFCAACFPASLPLGDGWASGLSFEKGSSESLCCWLPLPAWKPCQSLSEASERRLLLNVG
jgi:hypothetical protein